MSNENNPRFDWVGTAPGLNMSMNAMRHVDASVHIATRCGSYRQTVLLPRADAVRFRDWLCAQDLDLTRDERLAMLRQFLADFEAQHGAITAEEWDEAGRILDRVEAKGRQLPKSLGMGHSGDPNLSEREGFDPPGKVSADYVMGQLSGGLLGYRGGKLVVRDGVNGEGE